MIDYQATERIQVLFDCKDIFQKMIELSEPRCHPRRREIESAFFQSPVLFNESDEYLTCSLPMYVTLNQSFSDFIIYASSSPALS